MHDTEIIALLTDAFVGFRGANDAKKRHRPIITRNTDKDAMTPFRWKALCLLHEL